MAESRMWPRKTNSLWNEVVDMLPQIEHFEFTGGEPFMIQEHFDLLEKSVELRHANSKKYITIQMEHNFQSMLLNIFGHILKMLK